MVVVIAAVALAAVFVIAAVAIGRESTRLAAEPPRPVFDLDEAVDWVAGEIPFDVAAVLSHDDVRQILQWSLTHLRSRALSGNGSDPAAVGDSVVVGEEESVEYVLDRARAAGSSYSRAQVKAVLDAQLAYLQAIGAAGPASPEDVVDE
ncbi:MAG TPA: hypothetical protein VGR26_08665 [Acidimicrobiales bacterium]|nr:hypothetical protein [Acidimicrobiales bacterium]